MISTKLLTIHNSVEDMFDAILERNIPVSEKKMNLLPSLIAEIKGISYPTPIPMNNLQTISDKTTAILQIKSQIKTVITNSGIQITDDLTTYGNRIRAIQVSNTFEINGPAEYTGKNLILTAFFNGQQVSASSWSITSGNQYATINQYGRVDIVSGTVNKTINVQATYTKYGNYSDSITIQVTYDNQLVIQCPDTITGTSGSCAAMYNNTAVTPTWSITSGNQYATINQNGEITISGSGVVTIQAVYSSYTTTKSINVVYQANTTTETTVNEDGSTTTTTTTEMTDPETGSTTTTTTTTTTNEDGSTTYIESETTENTDGSSTTQTTTTNTDGSSSESTTQVSAPDPNTGSVTSNTTTTNYDDEGNTTGSSQNTTTENTDGSSSSTTTNYNSNGDPTDQTNQDTDSSGNVDTQNVEFDENGNSTVTGYTIDTANNPDGGKDITGDGVNTEFVPFDGTNGFDLHIRFKSRKQDQPNPPLVVDTEDTSSNYHFTILCSKDPNAPYPGFHIRWSLSRTNYSSGNLVFGYRGKTGSATNRNLSPAKSGDLYDFTISYDPNLVKYPSKFRCQDNLNGVALITLNIDFNPLEYPLTLGYNINKQGQPYRYSNVEVLEFTLTKL